MVYIMKWICEIYIWLLSWTCTKDFDHLYLHMSFSELCNTGFRTDI